MTVSASSTAVFISSDAPSHETDPAVYFRRAFTVEEVLRQATLRVTALGIVTTYLNGKPVGADDVLVPGWTSYAHRVIVSSYDVTEHIVQGENVVGAIVAEGWAAGRLSYEHRRHLYSDRPALYLELELDFGTHIETIGSDGNFRIGEGAVRSASIYDGETFDARLEPTGWNTPGFDDTLWAPAMTYDFDLAALTHDVVPPIRRTQKLPATSVSQTPSGRTVVDFGQVLTGWVRLNVTGPTGHTVTLRHAELLTPDGEPEYETLRTAQATDRYTLRGGGSPETWEPAFTFHGFRYVEVENWPGELNPEDLTAVVVHSDMARTGWFDTSDPLLSRFHENVVWSMRGNFVGVPTDCPQRDERMGWTGDLHAFAPTAAFLYDVRGVLGSWLADLAAEQHEKGYVPWAVPDVMTHACAPTALWSDAAVGVPWTLYREYGDEEILRRAWPSMTAFVTQVENLLDPDGLWGSGYQFGDWLDPDAPDDDAAGGKTDRFLMATAYFAETTRQMWESARVLGLDQAEKHFDELHRRVRDAFRREFVAPSGRMVSESATAYALAIRFGLVEGAQRDRAGARLADLVREAGYTISTGFAGTPLVADALTDTGHLDTAYLLMTERECPSFLYPVTMGATTVWERWDAVRPDGALNSTGMTSLNHYALGSAASWLHRVVGGLEALEPGYHRIRIAPRPGGGLTWARVAHETLHGLVEVQWRIEDGRFTLNVDIPEGTTAVITLPEHPAAQELEVGGGKHSWAYRLDREEREPYTFDTPLKTLADDPIAWRAITRVFRAHVPFRIDASLPEAASISLGMMLPQLPLATPELEQELRETIASL